MNLTEDLHRVTEIEDRKILERQKKKNQKIDEERIKQEKRATDFARREKDRDARKLKSATDSIKAIGIERLKDKLKELRERDLSGSAVLSGVEAGSVEAARLESERQNINPALRSQIQNIESQIAEEQKRLDEEKLAQLKIIADSLKGKKNETTLKTKTIN